MVRDVIPPLTISELHEAADAAAAIVTRCLMVPDDGFLAASDVLTLLQRKFTWGSNLELHLEGLCVVLAHPTIRNVLMQFGFKFQQ